MDIKIQSIRIIKPSRPTPENQRKFKLSLLDQFAASSNIDVILYFQASNELNISEKCTQLVDSLSQALTLFYPLAGMLTEDGLEVDCNDQGVMYLETRVNTTLEGFLNHGLNIDRIKQLIGSPDQATTMLVTIQVNVFSCGALAIGVSATHKVTDTSNLVRFVNEWASTNRTGVSTGAFYPSFDDINSIFPPGRLPSINNPPNDQETLIVNKRFVFDGAAISKLKAKASSSNRTHSRVSLVTSLIWKALITIDQVKCGFGRCRLLSNAMNLRNKVSSPISESSFGNVWIPYVIRFLPNEMDLKFLDVASLIEDTKREVVMWVSKAGCEEICTHRITCYEEIEEELKQKNFCLFTSWSCFPIYEVDFGWGKPYWASAGGSSIEMVILMDDKNGDGIEAWVSLKEKDMKLFEEDADILAFTGSKP